MEKTAITEELLTFGKDIFVCLHDNFGFDFEKNIGIYRHDGKFTVNSILKFVDVLEYDVTLTNSGGYIVAIVDVDGENWKTKLRNAKEFFESAAGYCTVDEYDEWFEKDPIYKVMVGDKCLCVTYDKEQAESVAKANNGTINEIYD